jgi:hypothetical protein
MSGHDRRLIPPDPENVTARGRPNQGAQGKAYARSFSWPRLPEAAMLSNEGRPRELGDPRLSEWW